MKVNIMKIINFFYRYIFSFIQVCPSCRAFFRRSVTSGNWLSTTCLTSEPVLRTRSILLRILSILIQIRIHTLNGKNTIFLYLFFLLITQNSLILIRIRESKCDPDSQHCSELVNMNQFLFY